MKRKENILSHKNWNKEQIFEYEIMCVEDWIHSIRSKGNFHKLKCQVTSKYEMYLYINFI